MITKDMENNVKGFVQKANYDIPFPVFFKTTRAMREQKLFACVEESGIFVDRYQLNMSCPVDIQSCLLHEVGHIHTHGFSSSPAEIELFAELWAIGRAKELRLQKVAGALLWHLKGWQWRDWKIDRVYMEAYKIFMKNYKIFY